MPRAPAPPPVLERARAIAYRKGMAPRSDAAALAAELEALFADRLHLRRGPLTVRVAQARRMLPAAIRRDARIVAEAAVKAGHPRLEAQIDAADLHAAHARVVRYLDGPEMRRLRSLSRLRMLAALAGNLLAVGALLIVVLIWRGFL